MATAPEQAIKGQHHHPDYGAFANLQYLYGPRSYHANQEAV